MLKPEFTPQQISTYFFAQKLYERGFPYTADAIRKFWDVPERPVSKVNPLEPKP